MIARSTILPFKGKVPQIAGNAFLAPGSCVIGDVVVGEHAGLWYGAILRGDVAPILIGRNSNVQDGAVVHVSRDRPQGTSIGENVTIGHMALIHACTIGDDCLIGMKACLMDGVVVERGAWVAAGALVTPGKHIRSGELWSGVPARHIRDLRPEDRDTIRLSAQLYVQNAIDHAEEVAHAG